MAKGLARESSGANHTICLPIGEEEYQRIIENAQEFRRALDRYYAWMPELFPQGFDLGYELKDDRVSKKTSIKTRRIQLKDGRSYSVRPSFVMPYHTARTNEVEKALFLRKFGLPYWALVCVFGRDVMYWYRLEIALGRNSIVGTTLRRATIPEDLLADEHHQTCDGQKDYIATTVAGGCCLGAALSESAGAEDLEKAYGVFRQEARDIDPHYAPRTVNTDGWQGTLLAWKALFPLVFLVRCFLHAWLKIRDRAKLHERFREIGQRVWKAYHAPNRRSLSQRLRSLATWARRHLDGEVLKRVLYLCEKRPQWTMAYDHPQAYRTSNMLDRVMRSMNRYFDAGQHLHGGRQAAELHCRSWALLFNFAPWHPATTKRNHGWQSPAERLNRNCYNHDCWLQNLLVSASLGGYRNCCPQNP